MCSEESAATITMARSPDRGSDKTRKVFLGCVKLGWTERGYPLTK